MSVPEKKIKNVLRAQFGDVVPKEISIFKVLKLDSGQFYYLISFVNTSTGKIHVVNLNESNLAISSYAEVDNPLIIIKPQKVADAEKAGGTVVELVWTPCAISFSSFYPFWRVQSREKVFYVDMDNNAYDAIPGDDAPS